MELASDYPRTQEAPPDELAELHALPDEAMVKPEEAVAMLAARATKPEG